jgi:superfamily I DNA and/or RNA helicase
LALELEVVFDHAPFDGQDQHRRWTLDACPDERTFSVMAMALNRWINEDRPDRIRLRDVVLGRRELPEVHGDGGIWPPLNAPQCEAVNAMTARPLLTVIQGPPGTGKTTTLVEGIRQLVLAGERVLAAAPSNAATDVIARQCLAAGLKVVRIGNPVRVDDEVADHSLESLVERDPEYKQVRDLRRRAEDAWRDATRHRRQFDADARTEKRAARAEAKDLQSTALELEQALEERVIRHADVVCATLTGTADQDLRPFHFPVLVVDEAGQALEPLVWAGLLKADRLVLAGDPQQLPPTVHASKAGLLEVSLLEKRMARLAAVPAPGGVLTIQYRMHAGIMGPVSDYFYGGQLLAHESVADRGFDDLPPWTFIDTAGCGFDEQREPEGESTFNPDEAAFVAARLAEIRKVHPEASIGVIAPYRAQVQALEAAMSPDLASGLDIHTVDSFQGQERDIILLSLTRSNPDGAIGFLSEYRRTNVAMSRARKHLLIVGDSSTLGNDPFFSWLVERSEADGAYRSAWESM